MKLQGYNPNTLKSVLGIIASGREYLTRVESNRMVRQSLERVELISVETPALRSYGHEAKSKEYATATRSGK